MKTQNLPIEGRQKVILYEVVMLKADINYTVLFFVNGLKSWVTKTLKSLELMFLPFIFFLGTNRVWSIFFNNKSK